MEDIKSEKLLMLTFSRAAASEFKKRLTELIGNAAKYVEIKTFHSYCFDILGQRGTLEKSEDIVKVATREIVENKVEISRITKSILVIDEAQDMSADEFALIEALIARNEDIRVIAVGDDDQNIYAFRGSDSMHLKLLLNRYGGVQYNMLENFRSHKRIIKCANDFARCIQNRLKSSPIIATHKEEGNARFTLHQCENYEEAIVKDIISRKPKGTTGVLTSRNEDALIIAALLNRNGHKARLIQSNEGFSLSDLAELHIFIRIIKDQTTSVISETEWESAKQQICSRFRNSSDLNTALRCIKAFETEYTTKYVSDLENFIIESDITDFDEKAKDEIVVSTIHKSKGHEYDNVFISLKGIQYISEEEKRAIYVGLTRARHTLSVHSNVDLSHYMNLMSADFMVDPNTYAEPSEVLMQLSHKDVVLSMFKGKTSIIEALHTGQEIIINDVYAEISLGHRTVKILKFAEAFRSKMFQLLEKGYQPHKASIRHIVYWRHEEIEDGITKLIEIPIVLPEILFTKQ
jgi:ATP-dependent DNA helicase RecQ